MVQLQYTTQYGPKPKLLAERFWTKVRIPDDPTLCWEWIGSRHKGYGQLKAAQGRTMLIASRVSWELHNGMIPFGMEVCHHCDNPPCVNPQHLFLGSHRENLHQAALHGRWQGESNAMARLNAIAVTQIRTLYATKHFTQKSLALTFHVSRSLISMIVNHRLWCHLP